MIRPGLAIFTKTPGLSPVKTRLAADIGTAAAEHFHRLAAAATAEVVRACGESVHPCWAVAEDDPRADAAWTGLPSIRQGAGGLGERMHRVHAALRARHGAALLLGTDIPQITPQLLLEAVAALQGTEKPHVLGPSSDGGFWLFGGTRELAPMVLRQTPYSVPKTAEVLCRALGDAPVVRLTTLTDVDSGADLSALCAALARLDSPTPGQRRLAGWLNERVSEGSWNG